MLWSCKVCFIVRKTIIRTTKWSSLLSQSQYLVEPPFVAISTASLWGYASARVAHLGIKILVHFSLQNSSSLVRLDGTICELQFSSLVTNSQFDLGLGFEWSILYHFVVALTVCLVSLSCWKVSPPSFTLQMVCSGWCAFLGFHLIAFWTKA